MRRSAKAKKSPVGGKGEKKSGGVSPRRPQAMTRGKRSSERRSAGGRRSQSKPSATRAKPTKRRSIFDLRPDAPPPPPRDLPWGYNETRVTAMPRDPRWLYVYWEATDEAITAAREKLGPGGPTAQFVLRVYDTTGREFDGTNANSYFDVPVERVWNNYFIEVNRPRAQFHVEIGMRSSEGYFAAMARSGAAEMPADSVWGESHAEWMSVVPVESPQVPPYRHRYTPRPVYRPPMHAQTPSPAAPPVVHGGELPAGQVPVSSGWSGEMGRALTFILGGETIQGEWFEQHLSGGFVRWIRWRGGRQTFAWKSGPHRIPLQSVGPVEIWFQGEKRVVSESGGMRVIEGPWHVVITGIGAHGERRVLDTWMVKMGWLAGSVEVRVDSPAIYRRIYGSYVKRQVQAGASEVLIREEAGASMELYVGASAEMWLWGSEVMLGGASETLMVGASEVFAAGASEFAWLGASETVWAGASEFLAIGASERQWLGASESLWGGASLFMGASGALGMGASEGDLGGASEQVLGGRSEVVGMASGPGWRGYAALPYSAGVCSGTFPASEVSSAAIIKPQPVSGTKVRTTPHQASAGVRGDIKISPQEPIARSGQAEVSGSSQLRSAGERRSDSGGRASAKTGTKTGQAAVRGAGRRSRGSSEELSARKKPQRGRRRHWLSG